ncbi:MAG: RagB/SusD family nutrient uptake outer membrane protein [Niabella sp.]
MKNILYFIILSGFLLALNSCSKDFLKEVPVTTLAPENSFDTKESARLVLDGVYDGLQDRGWGDPGTENFFGIYSFSLLNMLGSDINKTWTAAFFEDVSIYTLNANSSQVYGFWVYSYDVVNRANMFLDNVDKVPMSDELKDKYRAEALFLRSLMFFNCLRLWGDIPMPLSAVKSSNLEEIQIPRTPVANVYAQIIKDLEFCEAKLPAKGQAVGGDAFRKGEASKGAAQALLAQIYLYRASIAKRDGTGDGRTDYTQAYNYASTVINSGYALEPYFPDVWRKNDNSNTEVIFAVQHKSGAGLGAYGEGTMIPMYLGIPSSGPNYLHLGASYAEPMTANFGLYYYEAGDSVRKKWTVPNTNGISQVGSNYVVLDNASPNHWRWRHGKWRQFPLRQPYTGTGDYGIQVPVLRLGEMYLIVAEAQNEINNNPNAIAISAVNELRKRASRTNTGTVHDDVFPRVLNLNETRVPPLQLSAYNYTSFKEYLFKERAREMADEFCRYFDLQRWGRLIDAIKYVGTTNHPEIFWGPEPEYYAHLYVSQKHYLMPVPAAEIQANPKLTQNPGY